jgi:fructose-1,6-bisphosphatase/inositol monophosphatase family enzyme
MSSPYGAPKLSRSDWVAFENAVRSAAIAGGISAMSHFRGALAPAEVITSDVNPSTEADIQATAAILNSLVETIPALAAKLNLGYSFFAEELTLDEAEPERARRIEKVLRRLGIHADHVKQTTTEFKESFQGCIGILFDSLDGTTNFRGGIPFFCSGVSLFIGDQPRVGAVYDPIHNVAFYGSLRTNERPGPNIAEAWSWAVSTGQLSELRDDGRDGHPRRVIATHLTRSNNGKRQEMIDILSRFPTNTEGTFMINTGQLAMAHVASGHFSAYVNNHTNVWDIAAGAVLIQAAGGSVTDFDGNDLQYGNDPRVKVVATLSEDLHRELLQVVRSSDSTPTV